MTIGVNLGRQLVSSSSKNFAAKSSQYFGQLKYIYLSIKLYFPLHISEYYIFHISYPSIFMPTLGSLHRVRLRTQSNPLPCPPQHSLCSDSGPPKVFAKFTPMFVAFSAVCCSSVMLTRPQKYKTLLVVMNKTGWPDVAASRKRKQYTLAVKCEHGPS